MVKSLKIAFFLALFFSYLHAGVKGVSVNELEELRKYSVKVIDIRKNAEIKRTGVIPNSYKVNYHMQNGEINHKIWLKNFIVLVKDRNIKFVLISEDGTKANEGAVLLHKKKYTNPYYLKGGMNAWLNNGKKIIKRY